MGFKQQKPFKNKKINSKFNNKKQHECKRSRHIHYIDSHVRVPSLPFCVSRLKPLVQQVNVDDTSVRVRAGTPTASVENSPVLCSSR